MDRCAVVSSFLCLLLVAGAAGQDAASSSSRNAVAFIRSKRVNDGWKAKETAAAILAIASEDPNWIGFEESEITAIQQETRLALLDLVSRYWAELLRPSLMLLFDDLLAFP